MALVQKEPTLFSSEKKVSIEGVAIPVNGFIGHVKIGHYIEGMSGSWDANP